MSQKKGTRKQYSLTATIYDKRGRVLSTGENSYSKTHPTQYHFAKRTGRPEAVYLHAEIAALVRLKDVERAHRIVVERVGADGQTRPAEPCPICKLAIEHAGIEIVEHT